MQNQFARCWRNVGLTLLSLFAGCNSDPAVNRIGTNVVQKSVFEGSWYFSRTVIDVDAEGAGLGTFPGDAAIDFAGSDLASIPRIRWVIDENYLYAYRDYELVEGGNGSVRTPGCAQGEDLSTCLGHPVAAFKIESHFDIRRDYNTTTGEERNVVIENATDKRWYEREYMRVDWSKNLLPGYYGQSADLNEVFGSFIRQSADLFVQSQSDFPLSWQPRFDRMSCTGLNDMSAGCKSHDQDWATDYSSGDLYHFSFVTQDLLAPGTVTDPFTNQEVNSCLSNYADAPVCSSIAVYVRNSFLKVSDKREYEPVQWGDTRFERHGFFRLERPTYDRSTSADDAAYFATDFLNYRVNRHNIWRQWFRKSTDGHIQTDAQGRPSPLPYGEREVRPVVWYTTTEMPAHLIRPSFELVSEWNSILMSTVRHLQGKQDAEYARVPCQNEDPEDYCYCTFQDDTDGDGVADCPGRYDPFLSPEEHAGRGASQPYDCWVDLKEEDASQPALSAEPDLNDPALSDKHFYNWYRARMRGTECVNVLRVNTCNRGAIVANGGSVAGLECEERGDMRFKFLSYVDVPETRFLGIATLRGDPLTGELLVGDANIGGPALDNLRTFALQTYDLISGAVTDSEFLSGEDVRAYLAAQNEPQQPALPRVDFSTALLQGTADSAARSLMNTHMDRIANRVARLRGAEGKARTFSDRRSALKGTEIEKRLTDNDEALAMAGAVKDANHVSREAILDRVSPFRTDVSRVLATQESVETKVSRANVTLPNEYTDDSVLSFVNRHRTWSRSRLSFGLNRALYYETGLHEMGHCLGLRHQFGASADKDNYFDDYYLIRDRVPLPDPRAFDVDTTAGLSEVEQHAFEDAYRVAKDRRELAGIDLWMSSSVMEYTAQWYNRTVRRAGRYDRAAIAFGYGDLVEVYDNRQAQLETKDINPSNTSRVFFRYYQGGETCRVGGSTAQCPFSLDGLKANELLPSNRTAGLTQHCIENPSGAPGDGMCSNFDQDIASVAAASARPSWAPVNYRFCSDERVGTLGWCHRFDEGDSYREIVQNVREQYERQYVFTNFRRYRKQFDPSDYIFNRLLGRHFSILQDVFHNLLFRYISDPAYRTDTKAFGFYDQFMATVDALNFYAEILGLPDVGGYNWDSGWKRFARVTSNPNAAGVNIRVPLGPGRYASSVYQRGITGISRIERIGSFFDKWFTVQMLATRGVDATGGRLAYTRDVPFFVNYYDLFPVEMQQIFSGMIRGAPEEYMPRLECVSTPNWDPQTAPMCSSPRIRYLDFYRGDCSAPGACRPDPVQETYASLPVLDGGGRFLLQYLATIFAFSEFPVFFDTSFQNQLFICVEGQGDCHLPSSDAIEGEDFIRYTSDRYGKNFLAWQVEAARNVPNQTSIGFHMLKEAKDINRLLKVLRKYRGDDGGAPYSAANLGSSDQAVLTELHYVIPTDATNVDREVARLDGRLSDLESFFSEVIQLERDLGIAAYLR